MAGQGRGGDSMMAHMTPGEIAVPPQVQTPEVLSALNKAFASTGANPTSYQAGNPDQKVNPATGMPEFGFFDVALPLGLSVLGSAVGGPLIGAGLADLGVGAATSGLVGGAIGGGLGSAAGNVIMGKPLGYSLASGAAGALGGTLLGGALGGAFGSGPTPAVNVSQGANLTDFGGGGAAMGVPDVTAPALKTAPATTAAAVSPIWLDKAIDSICNINLKEAAGSALGSAIGSSLIDDYFPSKAAKVDLGPSLTPMKDLPPITNYVGGGSTRYPAARMPDKTYRPGIDSQFRYFPTG